MASVLNALHFQNEAAAYAKLESLVWPNGPVCPHCGGTERVKLMGGESTRPGVHKCYDCRKQCRVTAGTVFESSHVPLNIWLQAAYLMCSSKKGVSSNQLHAHDFTRHGAGEFVRDGLIHTNTVRVKLGVADLSRTSNALCGIVGKRLMYRDSLEPAVA